MEVVDVARGAVEFVRFEGGACLDADRLLIATGTQARTAGIGLATVGVDESEPLSVATDGRVHAEGSVWAIGDVAGFGEYTHLANHQARVVAGALVGNGHAQIRRCRRSGLRVHRPADHHDRTGAVRAG